MVKDKEQEGKFYWCCEKRKLNNCNGRAGPNSKKTYHIFFGIITCRDSENVGILVFGIMKMSGF